MDYVPHFSLIIACLVLVISFYSIRKRKTHGLKSKGNSTPKPSGAWPIVGHLHLLRGRSSMARTFGSLADKIGPIFSIQLGSNRAVVISSWEGVKDCFTANNDRVLATRPPSSAGKYLTYNYAAFGFAPYGPYWREMRKIVMLEILSTKRIEKLKNLRLSEVEESMKELYNSVIDNNNNNNLAKVVDISKWFEHLVLNMMVKTIAGKRYNNSLNDIEDDEEAKQFRRLVKEFMYAGGEFVLSDQIPLRLLKWLDLIGKIKNMKRISKEFDVIIQNWIDEHTNRKLKNEKDNEEDFIDVMLSVIDDKITYGYSRETIIKATVMNIIAGSSDTLPIALTWLMSLLLNNRHVLERAQEEIDKYIGKDRWVEESDVVNLSYLQAIFKETLRLYPPGPIVGPHNAIEDCNVRGYLIPKGTQVLVNAWKLHRDPRIWLKPNEFQPDRFLTTHVEKDVYGHHFEYVPFGSGRRSCPGITYALRVTHLTIARLLQGFEITTPSNLPVDMKEGPGGFTCPKANPLKVLLTPRLRTFLYTN